MLKNDDSTLSVYTLHYFSYEHNLIQVVEIDDIFSINSQSKTNAR